MPISREVAAEFARELCSTGASRNRFVEIVVVVSDEEGTWVGVAATVSQRRTADVLRAALHGVGRRDHPEIIDVEGTD